MYLIDWRDKYYNLRMYQLENKKEFYSKYSSLPDFKRDLILMELQLVQVLNLILDEKNISDELEIEAIDMLYGQIDEVALKLMANTAPVGELKHLQEHIIAKNGY